MGQIENTYIFFTSHQKHLIFFTEDPNHLIFFTENQNHFCFQNNPTLSPWVLNGRLLRLYKGYVMKL